MQKQTLTSIVLILTFFTAFAQANRSFDGSNNNLENSDWGASHTNLARVTDIAYENGFSTPAGADRPNPRAISNALFSQSGLLNEPRDLSCYIWTFGQFIDHDIDLTDDAHDELAMIPVPEGDPWFDPMSTGAVMIPMKRSEYDLSTGTSVVNPRQHPNRITAFIDGSAVYGSSQTVADWLRSFEGGKLKTSTGNLLPFNTVTGELDAEIDQNAPFMADAVGTSPKLFVAGDIRGNENVLLTSFHTLFMREHNRLCDEISLENPSWTDEEIYQKARKLNGAYIQSITFNEFLPSMGIHLGDYEGYNSSVNPAIMNVFSGAAYRLHSLINNEILRMDNSGNIIPEGNLSLKDAFFNPLEVVNGGGIDPLLKGMATLVTQDYDSKVIDDLRNFLFGAPGAGGLDLAAININRGRERGFPDYNTVRINFGLEPKLSCSEICSDEDTYAVLENMYGDVNNIDAFVGMVAENHMDDALLGETALTIIEHQFRALRDGDRFYYLNDESLTEDEKKAIDNTRLVDIIMRSSDVELMQGNLFAAMDHNTLESCGAASPNVAIQGNILNDLGAGIAGVQMDFDGSNLINDYNTNDNGIFQFGTVPSCYDYSITPIKSDNPTNGVTTYDLVLIQSHILGTGSLGSPYRIIAADSNADGNVSTFDIVELRQLILAKINEFPTNTPWRFVDANQFFPNPDNPFQENLIEKYSVSSLTNDALINFVGIKVGDVNGNANPTELNNTEDRNLTEKLIFRVDDRSVTKGQTYTVHFRANELNQVIGYQFTLNFDNSVLKFVDIETGKLQDLGTGNFGVFAEEGMITTSWNGSNEMEKDNIVFSVRFKAVENGNLRDLLSINSRLTQKEAISDSYELMDIALQFDGIEGTTESVLVEDKFEVYQNFPNPFKDATKIGFYLPKASTATVKISDISGKTLKVIVHDFAAGYNSINLNRKAVNASGVLYYEVQTDFGTVSKKMVTVD